MNRKESEALHEELAAEVHPIDEILAIIRNKIPKGYAVNLLPVEKDAWEITLRKDTLENFTDEVGFWYAKTFPKVTLIEHIEHMLKEMKELKDAMLVGDIHSIALESADLFLMLLALAFRLKFGLYEAARAKFEIIQNREYTIDQPEGSYRHDESILNQTEDIIFMERMNAVARALLSLGKGFITRKDYDPTFEQKGNELHVTGITMQAWNIEFGDKIIDKVNAEAKAEGAPQ